LRDLSSLEGYDVLIKVLVLCTNVCLLKGKILCNYKTLSNQSCKAGYSRDCILCCLFC